MEAHQQQKGRHARLHASRSQCDRQPTGEQIKRWSCKIYQPLHPVRSLQQPVAEGVDDGGDSEDATEPFLLGWLCHNVVPPWTVRPY